MTAPLQIGELHLDPAPWGSTFATWMEQGGETALHALAPVAAMDPNVRHTMKLLAVGPGAPLAAVAAVQMNLLQVHLVCSAKDREALQPLRNNKTEFDFFTEESDVPTGRHYHRILYGSGKQSVVTQDCAAWVKRLKPEGQFLLFALPEDELQAAFKNLASKGFALRGSGRRQSLGFLAGTLEHGHRLG